MEGGIHTAATSSQVTDGASAVLLASEDAVKRHGLTPRGRIVDGTIVGVDPVTMLKGPIPVTRKLLARNELTIEDFDVYEVNEAFASWCWPGASASR
jgi:acetyl-CoA C-acetyltransferase